MLRYTLVLICLLPLSFCSKEKAEHGGGLHGAAGQARKLGIHNPVFDTEALLGEISRRRKRVLNSGETGAAGEDLEDLPDNLREKRLRTLAASHDNNKNGIIEKDELHDWIMSSFAIVDHEEATERLAEDDKNEDGKVTLAEILEKQYGYSEEDLASFQKDAKEDEDDDDAAETAAMLNEEKMKFEAADLNKDGTLDEKEFQAFYLPHNYPHMYDVELQRSINDMDKNKDGFVSKEEFIMDTLEEMDAEDAAEEQRAVEESQFVDLDKDNDGKLSKEEMRPWVLTDNESIAKEEVEHLLTECDKDGDHKLTIDEIIEKADEFATSSATDYGRVLHFVRDEL